MRPICRIVAVSFLCPLMLAGCGGMLPGTIYSDDGKTIPFEIERAHRSGTVTAFDPAAAETFSGNYVAIVNGVNSVAYMPNVGWGVAGSSSRVANATAFLRGDKGTVLTCQMQIERGFSPHGIGGCTDNRSKDYHLQF